MKQAWNKFKKILSKGRKHLTREETKQARWILNDPALDPVLDQDPRVPGIHQCCFPGEVQGFGGSDRDHRCCHPLPDLGHGSDPRLHSSRRLSR